LKTLVACVAIYVVALCVWVWLARPAEKPPPFTPVDVRFCQDWRDMQPELCDRIPFRKEWSV
jgi:hypothetical protein